MVADKYNNNSKCQNIEKIDEDEIIKKLAVLKDWAKTVTHLVLPDDDEFLLRFLVASKYNCETAMSRIDNFCTLRSSPKGVPAWFNFSRLTPNLINEVLELDLMVPLGVSENGQMIILSQLGKWDPDAIPFESVMQVLFMGIDLLVAKDVVRTHGVSIIMDLDRANGKVMRLWNQSPYMKRFSKIWENVYPMKVKNMVFYREPVMFNMLYSMAKLSMKSKLNRRTLILKNDIEKASDIIPGLMAVLPFEYNGSRAPLDVMRCNWKQEFLDNYKTLAHLYSGITVSELKRKYNKKKISKNQSSSKAPKKVKA